MIETILSTPVTLSSAIIMIPLWFLLDFIFHGKITVSNSVFNLLSGAVFAFLAYGGNLTVGLGFILIIPLSILSSLLARALFKKEHDNGNN